MVPYIGSKFLVFFLLFEMVECMIQFHHKQEICRKLLIIVFSLLVVLVLFFLIPGEFSPPLFGLNLKWTLTLLYKLKSSTWYAKDLFPWILYTQKTTEPSEGLKIRGCQYYLMGIICPPPPGWDRVNWSAKIWGCHGNPDTPRDNTPGQGFTSDALQAC